MAPSCDGTILWGINPPFDGLSPCKGQVAYALLTRAPVSNIAIIPLDLHVLSLPLAFILSQDQTLRCIENFKYNPEPQALLFFPYIILPLLTLRLIQLSYPEPSQSSLLTFLISFNELCLSFLSPPSLPQNITVFRSFRECKCKAFFIPKQNFLPFFPKIFCPTCRILIPYQNLSGYPQRTSPLKLTASLRVSPLKRGCKDKEFCIPAIPSK